MAPKKGGKGDKKDKGKDSGAASAELTEKELLLQAQLRIESLEQQLVWREEKTQVALAGQKELQDRVAAYHADFEREKEEIFDISADMTRQYKGMQEELIAQINKHEQTIAEQKDQLERSQLALEEVRRQMAVELALKDSEIAEQKQKMEDMAVEFGEVRVDYSADVRSVARAARRARPYPARPHARRGPRILTPCSLCMRSVPRFILACADAEGDSRQDEREDRNHKSGVGGGHGRQHRQEARGAQDGRERRSTLT
jgi:hypothetical protein